MYRLLFLILLFAGCASFAAIDLRPSDPPELGDLYGFETTSVRYRVMAIDPDYVENHSRLECVNTMRSSLPSPLTSRSSTPVISASVVGAGRGARSKLSF